MISESNTEVLLQVAVLLLSSSLEQLINDVIRNVVISPLNSWFFFHFIVFFVNRKNNENLK